MRVPIKLAILAMVAISTTAKSVVDNDAAVNIEDSEPEEVKINEQASNTKIQDSKSDATIETFNITGLSDKSEDGTIRAINITGNVKKSDNATLRAIAITGKGIKSDHATLGVVNITENNIKSNDNMIVRAYNITGKVVKTDLLDSKPVDGTFKVVNFDLNGIDNRFGLDVIDILPESVASILKGLCKDAKKLAGVEYEHVNGTVDLNMLTLNLFSDKVTASLKLGTVDATLLNIPGYNCTQPLVIFMHGFIDDPKLFNFPAVNKAFHKHGYFNILALDASPLIRYLYLRSSTYVQLIGERLGATLGTLVKAGLNPKDIHLVGHSLGAHIAGFTGKNFYKQTGSLIGRITGLDPAGPCFSQVDQGLRLQATDAQFVDVIHTDGGVYGLTEPVGHVDYYPNGGKDQPNCILNTCSHNRVVELFAASVMDPNIFPARACKDWQEFKRGKCSNNFSLMGYGSKPSTRGLYYLRTGDTEPYGLGEKGLSPKTLLDFIKTDLFINGK